MKRILYTLVFILGMIACGEKEEVSPKKVAAETGFSAIMYVNDTKQPNVDPAVCPFRYAGYYDTGSKTLVFQEASNPTHIITVYIVITNTALGSYSDAGYTFLSGADNQVPITSFDYKNDITITSSSATRITGTFRFRAIDKLKPTNDTLLVTNGQFDVPIK